MSDTIGYAIIALAVGLVIYVVLGKIRLGAKSNENYMDIALNLSRECVKEAQETNRLLKEIKELLEKK